MTSRVALLCLLASAKACWWTVEQPQSSIMDRHPSFQKLMSLLPVRRLSMLMGDFGGASKKATSIWSRFLGLTIGVAFLGYCLHPLVLLYICDSLTDPYKEMILESHLAEWGHREIDSLLDERSPSTYTGERPEMTIRYIDGSGRQRCKGGKDLKGSQAYPRKSLDHKDLV